jgi:hypothetical protein
MFESGGQIVDPQEKLEQTSLQSYYKKIPVYRTGLERTMNIEPMPNQVPNSTKRKRMAYEEGGQIAEPPAESAENKTSKEKEEIKEPEIKEPEIKEPANKKAKKNLTAESKTDPEKEQTEKPDDKQDDKVTGLAAVDQKNYNSIKNTLIKRMVIVRSPVKPGIVKALNVLSLGALNSIQNKLGYDTLWHLAIKIDLANGQSWRIEKNQNISIKKYTAFPDTQSVTVPVSKPITLKDMMNKLYKKQGNKMYEYDAFKANCQMFVRDLLSSSGLFPASVSSFVSQNTPAIHKSLPGYVSTVAKAVTNIGAKADYLIQKFFGKKVFEQGGQITI